MTTSPLSEASPRLVPGPVARPTDHERLELLLETGRILDEPLDLTRLLVGLARALVTRLCEVCAIDILAGDEGLVPLALVHTDADCTVSAQDLRRRFPLRPEDRTGPMSVLRAARGELYVDLPRDPAGSGARAVEFLAAFRELGMTSAMVAPICAEGHVVGTLTALSGARRFDTADLRFLEEIGARAGCAVDRYALREPRVQTSPEQDRRRPLVLDREGHATLEVALYRISTLQSVTAALSEAVTLNQVAEIIVGESVASLGAQAAVLFLQDEGREGLEIAAHRGLSAERVRAAARIGQLEGSSVGRAARTGQAVWASGDPLSSAPSSEMSVAVPLAVGGRIAGVLALSFGTASPLADEHRHFVLALVRYCAQAVDRARLYETEWCAHRRLDLLTRAGDLLSSSIDYDTTLENVTRAPLPALADYCFLDVVEDSGVRRIARTEDDRASSVPSSSRSARSGHGVIASVLDSGKGVLHTDVSMALLEAIATDAAHFARMRELPVRSLIIVPVVTRDQTLGAMTLCFGPSGRRYGRVDLEICEELARRSAIAVENAMLHRAVREAMQRAQDANRRSEEANHTKDEFLGVVSHELRTPLNAVLGWAQLLRGPCANDPAVLAKGLRVIDRNARAQAKLIEDILDVSRIIAGKLRLEVRQLDLEGVIRTAIDVIRPTADAKGVALWSFGETPVMVSGDADRLQQVVWNLLSNAVKFTPQGGRIEVRLVRERSFAVIVIRDTGRGIDREFLPYVFERFRQADGSPTRRHGGLGLGLAIVRHLVEVHGGSIRAESEGTGNGATFTVRLPLNDHNELGGDFDALPPTVRETDPGKRTGVRLDGLRVLVVDDEPDARDLVAAMLSASGASVAVAGSAAEALLVLPAFRPEVMVSDVGMPGEDGYALIRAVRSSGAPHARVPAVALTAYAAPEDARRAVLAGFHTHLPKPAEPSMLIAVVASLGGRLAIG